MITLYLRYTFDPNKISDVKAYAEAELRPITESGGKILGYFLPTEFAGPTNHATVSSTFLLSRNTKSIGRNLRSIRCTKNTPRPCNAQAL